MENNKILSILEDLKYFLESKELRILEIRIPSSEKYLCMVHVSYEEFKNTFPRFTFKERLCSDFPWEVYTENAKKNIKVFSILTDAEKQNWNNRDVRLQTSRS